MYFLHSVLFSVFILPPKADICKDFFLPGCNYKNLVFTHNTAYDTITLKGDDHTVNTHKLTNITNESIEEVEHQLRKFQAEFEKGLITPEAIDSFSEMEKLLEGLVHETRKTYLDTFSRYLSSIDEKELIRLKKENTGERG